MRSKNALVETSLDVVVVIVVVVGGTTLVGESTMIGTPPNATPAARIAALVKAMMRCCILYRIASRINQNQSIPRANHNN